MKKTDKNKIKYSLYLLAVVISIVFIFFSENGLIKYMQTKGEISDIRSSVDSSKTIISNLDKEIDSLRTNAFKIEKVAREKYNLKKDGEKVFKIKAK